MDNKKSGLKVYGLLALVALVLSGCGGNNQSVGSSQESSSSNGSSIDSSSSKSSSGEPSSSSAPSESSTSSSASSESSASSSSSSAPTTYSFALSISVSGTFPSTFGNIQFVYNYTNGTANSDYTWDHTISSASSATYSFSISDLSYSSTLYWKIYIWDSTLGDCFIGDASDANFSLVPNKAAMAGSLSFAYPTSSSTVGTYIGSNPSTSMSFADQTTEVYGDIITIAPIFDGDNESFEAVYSGENIRIDDNKSIIGLKAGTTTAVTLTSANGLTCSFNAVVSSSIYSSNYDSLNGSWATDEGWFNDVSVGEIASMGSSFMNGIDISSCKGLYDNGSHFYNASGVEQSLFYILKDAGVNWVRLRLWVDPEDSSGTSYGGGFCDLSNVTWMAHEAKEAGLNLLLDFHYSDFWSHPGQQIISKKWTGDATVSALAASIKSYTTSVLTSLKASKALPDMVQLGNELTAGICLQTPGTESTSITDGEPSYLYNKTTISSTLSGSTSNMSNLRAYLTAASEGVDAVDSSIKKLIHWAKGSTFSAAVINSFFNNLSTVDYDIAGISAYPYYHFDDASGGLDLFETVTKGISIKNDNVTGNVPWCVAETSYPFTSDSYVYANSIGITAHSVTSYNYAAMSGYPYSITGQANMIRDLTSTVVTNGGIGLFVWEGAWIPNASVGWASAGSPCSWANQGFFSYDGKALGSLGVYKQMNPNL